MSQAVPHAARLFRFFYLNSAYTQLQRASASGWAISHGLQTDILPVNLLRHQGQFSIPIVIAAPPATILVPSRLPLLSTRPNSLQHLFQD